MINYIPKVGDEVVCLEVPGIPSLNNSIGIIEHVAREYSKNKNYRKCRNATDIKVRIGKKFSYYVTELKPTFKTLVKMVEDGRI